MRMFSGGLQPHVKLFIYLSGQIITTSLRPIGIMVKKEEYPKMAQHFRLVNYYHLPRFIDGSLS